MVTIKESIEIKDMNDISFNFVLNYILNIFTFTNKSIYILKSV